MLIDIIQGLLDMVASLPPLTGFLAIILATFVLEDVAIVGTGLLASTLMIDPVTGGIALLVGIVLGDFGLFALGRGAAHLPLLRQYVDTQAAQRLKGVGNQRSFSLILSTRFVPGMRLPTYTGLGYVGVSFWRFSYAVLFAVTVWTIGLYSLVILLGQNILEAAGPWKWTAIAVILGVVFLVERTLIRRKRAEIARGEAGGGQ